MGGYGELFGQLAATQNFDSIGAAIGETDTTHGLFINPCAIVEPV